MGGVHSEGPSGAAALHLPKRRDEPALFTRHGWRRTARRDAPMRGPIPLAPTAAWARMSCSICRRCAPMPRSLCRRTQDPDDLVQETLLRAIEFAHSYQPGTKLRAWLFTIMRSRFYNDCRRRDRERTGDADCVSSLPRSPPSQDWHLRHKEMLVALDAIPVHYREALVLVAVLGESYSAAAAILGCDIGTIKSRVGRARGQLRRAHDPDF